MKSTIDKMVPKKNGNQSDDDNVRYKLNEQFFNNHDKLSAQVFKRQEPISDDDDDAVRYKFPPVLTKPEKKLKLKPKIKVNFWSNKTSRLQNTVTNEKTNRRHTVAITDNVTKPKSSAVKVRKRVSFLPSPLFSENHVPMVTVPDDLTFQLNEEEANDLAEDLNLAFVNSKSCIKSKPHENIKKSQSSTAQTSPRGLKRKQSEESDRIHGNDNELEYFSKYVVQKLRRMETNQRIYSENLINTVLMQGQLGKLNGKSKIEI